MVLNHKKLNTDVNNNNDRHYMSAQFGLDARINQSTFTFNFPFTDQQRHKALPKKIEIFGINNYILSEWLEEWSPEFY